MCLRYVWSCVCVVLCVPDCHGLHLNRIQQLSVCSVIDVCLFLYWFVLLCYSVVEWSVLMNGAGGQYILPEGKRQRCEDDSGVRSCCLIGHASWNGNVSFLLFNRLKEQEREETDRDSYGCLKERDKENRKEERREARSVSERRVKNWCAKVAESKQGACCQ